MDGARLEGGRPQARWSSETTKLQRIRRSKVAMAIPLQGKAQQQQQGEGGKGGAVDEDGEDQPSVASELRELWGMAAPIALLWLHVVPILVALGQDPTISASAAAYAAYALPDLAASAVLQPLRVYLRSQGITKPMAACSAIAVALHVPLNVLLVFGLGFGVRGVAVPLPDPVAEDSSRAAARSGRRRTGGGRRGRSWKRRAQMRGAVAAGR